MNCKLLLRQYNQCNLNELAVWYTFSDATPRLTVVDFIWVRMPCCSSYFENETFWNFEAETFALTGKSLLSLRLLPPVASCLLPSYGPVSIWFHSWILLAQQALRKPLVLRPQKTKRMALRSEDSGYRKRTAHFTSSTIVLGKKCWIL